MCPAALCLARSATLPCAREVACCVPSPCARDSLSLSPKGVAQAGRGARGAMGIGEWRARTALCAAMEID